MVYKRELFAVIFILIFYLLMFLFVALPRYGYSEVECGVAYKHNCCAKSSTIVGWGLTHPCSKLDCEKQRKDK